MSSNQNPGYLLYIQGIILPTYIGILVHHYNDPDKPIRTQWNVIRVFESCSDVLLESVFKGPLLLKKHMFWMPAQILVQSGKLRISILQRDLY